MTNSYEHEGIALPQRNAKKDSAAGYCGHSGKHDTTGQEIISCGSECLPSGSSVSLFLLHYFVGYTRGRILEMDGLAPC